MKALLPVVAAASVPSVIYDFGKAAPTGLCVREGMGPIVSFPRWGDQVLADQPEYAVGVVELDVVVPMRGLKGVHQKDADPVKDLVSVQALYCDPNNRTAPLWVLDTGTSLVEPTLAEGAAKLVQVELREHGEVGMVKRTYTFSKEVVPDGSTLNDVRFDQSGFAYITDSGLGGIVVLDLATGVARRWSDERMKAKLRDGEHFVVQGHNLDSFQIAVDGIAYSALDDFLYWKPITHTTLYRTKASTIREGFPSGDFSAATKATQDLGIFGFHDGLDADRDGGLYLTDVEKGAIQWRAADGTKTWLSPQGGMIWPDAVIAGRTGIYVLTTQVHLLPFVNDGKDGREIGNQLLFVPYPERQEL
mmetsp:Transcript_32344/g.72493  ORF Transcript_32344/g.72493 Transcript_32344/m.72493 type:complete len:361 (-) Transcript_32344:72-1154(-)